MSIVVNKTRLPVTKWQTESGSVVSINNARRRDAKSAGVTLQPIKDLHGYANPWVGGAGKNLCQTDTYTIPENSSGNLVWSGDLTGTYTISIDTSLVTSVTYPDASIGTVKVDGTTNYIAFSSPIVTVTGNITDIRVFGSRSYARAVGTVKIQLETGSSATSWSPYSNLCPISGHSAVHLHHAGISQSDNPTAITVQLGQTVYGGSVDLCSGVGTLTMANIASYNGETIGEPWLSSMDKYVAGATPTTGAQVVYTLATPITFQLSPNQLEMLERYNTIWADEGDISVTYARIHS